MTEPLRLTIVTDRIRAMRDRQDQLVQARLALRPAGSPAAGEPAPPVETTK